jgi:cytochrome c551/c552
MVDLIAYIRSLSTIVEKIYLSPGDPQSGEKWFTQKGCIQCHAPGGQYDLSKKKEFPRTLSQLAGMMWNHSEEMGKEMEQKGITFPHLSSQEMADLVAYLFSTRYFDEPGNAERGKVLFVKNECSLCHKKGTKEGDLSRL